MLAQLLNRSCNSPDAVFRTLRDFLSATDGIDDFSPSGNNPGPGYELVDASYASGSPDDTTTGDWCVLRSHGEAGTYPTYIRLNFGATQHGINIGLGWDAASHVGFAFTNRQTNIYHNGVGNVGLYIYADLDEIHIVMLPRSSSNWYWHPCGRLKPGATFYDGSVVLVAEPIQAGADVEIAMPTWPGWAEVGRKIYSWDQSSIHELTIAAASEASRTIAVDTAYDKAAGSWLAEDLAIFTNSSHNSSATEGRWVIPPRIAPFTTAIAAYTELPNMPGLDGKYGVRYGCDIWIRGTNEIRGTLTNARLSRYATAAQGEAWTDDEGQSWRLHTAYNGVVMAFREAI